ncbi:histidine kinase [Paraconexibacter antarcticus]|uniref:Histidine kinase n=1 Tax=Paraconexibacter antarcticus TaxID=2949664 RepID=A0ABY5DUR5_9ACTN|nr:histidine kinase [Paraconexibacter antarcticus]UTI64395.1 histidine kinase [Paraconexibacter antarcticus]
MDQRPGTPSLPFRRLAVPAAVAAACAVCAHVSTQGARRRATRDVADERRRIARELHDGLAQDLAFLAQQADALAARADGPPAAADMAVAAHRALAGARAAIGTLRGPADEPLAEAIARAAGDAATRWGAAVRADVDAGVELAGPAREAVLGIVSEAAHNAAVHGRPREVHVELRAAPALRLCVRDDGVGFDPGVDRPGHHGLTGMRERAAAVGGALEIRSGEGHGTQVVVMLA